MAEPQLSQLTGYRLGSPDMLLRPPTHTHRSKQSGNQWAFLSTLSCGSGTQRSEPTGGGGMLLRDHQETTASVSIAMTWAPSPLTPDLMEGQNEFLDGETGPFVHTDPLLPLPLRPGSSLSKHQGSDAMICQNLVCERAAQGGLGGWGHLQRLQLDL